MPTAEEILIRASRQTASTKITRPVRSQSRAYRSWSRRRRISSKIASRSSEAAIAAMSETRSGIMLPPRVWGSGGTHSRTTRREPGCRVREPSAGQQQRDGREQEDPGPAAGRRAVVALAPEAGPDGQIRLSGKHRSEQLRQLAGVVLAVAVDLDGDLEAAVPRELVARLHG